MGAQRRLVLITRAEGKVQQRFKLQFDHKQTLQLLNTQEELLFERQLSLSMLIFILLICANINAIANLR